MISVITWDANFRESLHTVDFFANQDIGVDQYEFIWVDFYNSNDNVREKISQHKNFRLIELGHGNEEQWHLGKCINAGVADAGGDLLVIPDGDIAVEEDFLSRVYRNHKDLEDIVIYHKRYDEPKQHSCEESRRSIEYLKTHTNLYNPTNYAGCLTISKNSLLAVNGYETHPAFAGPGINGIETYIRFRNAGYFIKWEPNLRIYHPWHPSSGSAGHNELELLREAKASYPWINPYAGLEQSWITHRRELLGEICADEAGCDQLLAEMPTLESIHNKIRKKHSTLASLLHILRK